MPVSVEVQDLITEPVKKVTIVRYENNGARKLFNTFLHYFKRLYIKIIRWFIEQKNIGWLHHETGNEDSGLQLKLQARYEVTSI
jgi:hypothetical protein